MATSRCVPPPVHPDASDQQCLKAGRYIILGLGVVTWMICVPRLTTLASLLYFTGAFVASAIWPIVFGLYHSWASGRAATLAMIAGSSLGLLAYFQIGFYVAALASCAVSLATMVTVSYFERDTFDFTSLSKHGETS